MAMHALLESSVGYSLFNVTEFEDVGSSIAQVESAAIDSGKFKKSVKFVAFRPFTNALESLENMNAISEGILTTTLEEFLVQNLTTKDKLGTIDPVLGQAIKEAVGCTVTHMGIVPEIVRGMRQYLCKYIKKLTEKSVDQACLSLAHAYSRSKVKFNVNRVDNMIIQGIAINDQIDKDLNTFAMRLREWYSYHFPELSKVVPDHYSYAQVVKIVQAKEQISDDMLPELVEVLKDDDRAQEVIAAARMSMGMSISEEDLQNVNDFADKVINMSRKRKDMKGYLNTTMTNVAPNLGAVVGDQVGARLISHAGSLTKLCKLPASTVQILGAEKALFRALKTKSKTPKYGLLYHSTHIGKAATKDKGRISRFLANKCAIASRIDNFSETLTSTFGDTLRKQIEERLQFYETGDIPRKNVDVMAEAQKEHQEAVSVKLKQEKKLKKKSKKNKSADDTNGSMLDVSQATENGDVTQNGNGTMSESPKKKKKKKKNSADETMDTTMDVSQVAEEETTEKPKKKKRKSEAMAENGTAEVAESTEEPPKKKKKKSKGDANQTISCQAEAEQAAEANTEKKKKKKKKRESL